jgi:hypothetical protein
VFVELHACKAVNANEKKTLWTATQIVSAARLSDLSSEVGQSNFR